MLFLLEPIGKNAFVHEANIGMDIYLTGDKGADGSPVSRSSSPPGPGATGPDGVLGPGVARYFTCTKTNPITQSIADLNSPVEHLIIFSGFFYVNRNNDYS